MISVELLKTFGAVEKKIKKGGVLFREGEAAFFYYQIAEGLIKMNNYTDDGQEIIQGLFKDDESFGEPPLLGNFLYPANAEAVEDSHIICLEKHRFIDLLTKNVHISIDLLAILSNRLQFKSLLTKEMKGYEADHIILTLLHYLKKKSGVKDKFYINMTRQTLANLTGLRVETVIRTIKKLQSEGKVCVVKHKIYV